MIDVNQLRKGVIYEWDNALWKVIDFWHIKMGRGKAVIRTKARNLRTGSTVEHTFDSGDRVQNATLETVHTKCNAGNRASAVPVHRRRPVLLHES